MLVLANDACPQFICSLPQLAYNVSRLPQRRCRTELIEITPLRCDLAFHRPNSPFAQAGDSSQKFIAEWNC